MRWSLVALISIAGCHSEAGERAVVRDPPEVAPSVIAATSDAPPGPEAAPHADRKRACISEALVGADPRLHGLIRAVCAEWVERELPGLALAVAEPGAAAFELQLGVRCLGEATPVGAATQFRFGSISKPVTAALALGLVADRRLSLTGRAGALVAGYDTPSGVPDPTLGALLSHRSGLGEIAPAQLVELDGAWLPALARSAAAGAPGEYHYSNAGYAVIGAMLSAATSQDYPTLVGERVAAPLGLGSFTVDAKLASAAACGHLDGAQGRAPIRVADDLEFMPGDPSWMNPGGGVLGSAIDLAWFALALGSERLPGTAAMLEPGEPLPQARRPDERYGYGLRSWSLADRTTAYGHSGNNGAFAAELMFVPGRRAIVLLTNCGAELPASVAAADQLLTVP
ncbi:Beta-lactamase [Enhygromyxa salina]|uniref:Beta-lactamase n=1 Tax=Enhygromyxa salina TaxID=215803 RepID=A0A0C1Z9J9_9BACT|nr:serine hydrolase domain-containing protein [Enhygromyxa salina]KIG14239.1 Beta-lactamase [Enhygromyxa salina]